MSHPSVQTDRDISRLPPGRILSLDLGEKRIGVAVCDELRLTIRPLKPLSRSNWKAQLEQIRRLVQAEAVVALVVGLPLRLDGASGEAAEGARDVARKLALSLSLPVFLQDERLTSWEAATRLRTAGLRDSHELKGQLDGEAAALLLHDFLAVDSR